MNPDLGILQNYFFPHHGSMSADNTDIALLIV